MTFPTSTLPSVNGKLMFVEYITNKNDNSHLKYTVSNLAAKMHTEADPKGVDIDS